MSAEPSPPGPPSPPQVAGPAAPCAARGEELPSADARHGLAPGRQLLLYTPEGALGGTFTCTACAAQAWQPDLLDHAPSCPYRPGAAAGATPPPAAR